MGRPNRLPPFVAVYKQLLKDPSFRGLNSSAKVLYIYLRSKFNTQTLGEVSLAYTEMRGVRGLSSSATINRAFKTLQNAGFIEKVNPGGLVNGVTIYRFIGAHKDFHYKGHKV